VVRVFGRGLWVVFCWGGVGGVVCDLTRPRVPARVVEQESALPGTPARFVSPAFVRDRAPFPPSKGEAPILLTLGKTP